MKRILLAAAIVLVTAAPAQAQKSGTQPRERPKVTIVELGSVSCIPCKLMQPIMKSLEAKYGSQVRIVVYDVRTDEGRPYSATYKIRVIPTQVFLDAGGKEFHRHEGFYPETEIDAILAKRGLTILKNGT